MRSADSRSAADVRDVDDVQVSLYAKRQKIYPREVHGLFAFWRRLSAALLLGIYYFTPWMEWYGRPLLLFDLPARRFHVFGLTFWPQDFIYLSLLLIVAALSLFFFTAIAGRLWCGYACPQTVWTEVFLAIEQALEGDRNRQMKLDTGPWTLRKLRIKVTKHSAWLLFAALTGFTFVAYFAPARDLAHRLITASLGPWETFWLVFYSFATYGNAGWMREQVCKYMCPYARFQSAMFDADTFIIAYDQDRGEPRGSRPRGVVPRTQGLGDCIDCTLCIQVCPTGIDIRRGLQYECIGCAACIDVCNDVMGKMGYPGGLIRYATDNRIRGRQTRLLRPRTLLYGLLLLTLMTGLSYSLLLRVPVALDVIRDRNQLYHQGQDGQIENVYTLKIINMDNFPRTFTIAAEGIDDLHVNTQDNPLTIGGDAVVDVPVRLRTKAYNLEKQSSEVTFIISASDDPTVLAREQARFLGPASKRTQR